MTETEYDEQVNMVTANSAFVLHYNWSYKVPKFFKLFNSTDQTINDFQRLPRPIISAYMQSRSHTLTMSLTQGIWEEDTWGKFPVYRRYGSTIIREQPPQGSYMRAVYVPNDTTPNNSTHWMNETFVRSNWNATVRAWARASSGSFALPMQSDAFVTIHRCKALNYACDFDTDIHSLASPTSSNTAGCYPQTPFWREACGTQNSLQSDVQMHEAFEYEDHRKSHNESLIIEGFDLDEPICATHLHAVLDMLPCRNQAGIASTLEKSVVSGSDFWSIMIHINPCSSADSQTGLCIDISLVLVLPSNRFLGMPKQIPASISKWHLSPEPNEYNDTNNLKPSQYFLERAQTFSMSNRKNYNKQQHTLKNSAVFYQDQTSNISTLNFYTWTKSSNNHSMLIYNTDQTISTSHVETNNNTSSEQDAVDSMNSNSTRSKKLSHHDTLPRTCVLLSRLLNVDILPQYSSHYTLVIPSERQFPKLITDRNPTKDTQIINMTHFTPMCDLCGHTKSVWNFNGISIDALVRNLFQYASGNDITTNTMRTAHTTIPPILDICIDFDWFMKSTKPFPHSTVASLVDHTNISATADLTMDFLSPNHNMDKSIDTTIIAPEQTHSTDTYTRMNTPHIQHGMTMANLATGVFDTIITNVESYPVVVVQYFKLPWQIYPYLHQHTGKIISPQSEPCQVGECPFISVKQFIPGTRSNPTLYTLIITLPSNSRVYLHLPFIGLHGTLADHPPDSHRGIEIFPCTFEIFPQSGYNVGHDVLSASSFQNTNDSSEASLIPVTIVRLQHQHAEFASPDFSMSFNVATYSGTVLAFLAGSLVNILARRPATAQVTPTAQRE